MARDKQKIVDHLAQIIKDKYENEPYRQKVRDGLAGDFSNVNLIPQIDCVDPVILFQTSLLEVDRVASVATVYMQDGVIKACIHPAFNYVDL